MRQRAFTLVELLVVISIILVLAGIIIGAGAVVMKDRAKILTTEHRINQVLTGLAQYTSSGDIGERLQRIAGVDKRFASLRSIMSLLTDKYNLDMTTATRGAYTSSAGGGAWSHTASTQPRAGTAYVYPSDGQLPPDLGNRWENLRKKSGATLLSAVDSRPSWASPNAGLEDVVTFMDRQISRKPGNASVNADHYPMYKWPNLAQLFKMPGATNYWYLVAWDDVEATHYVPSYGSGFSDDEFGTFFLRRGTASSRGESLNGTLEILPDSIRSPAWYITQWPNLVETTSSSGSTIFFQASWPDSDWDQSTPGSKPVIWHWPWGKSIFSRIQGSGINQTEYRDDGAGSLKPRTLAECSPLASIALLQAAGVIPADAAGAKAYREDRSPGKNWNDAWGSPLVVIGASFIPARYTYDDVNDPMPHISGSSMTVNGATGTYIARDTRSMLGPRDLFMKKSKEMYQYSRSFYAAVGSLGGGYPEELGSTWSATDDAVTLRKLWLRIRTETRAEEWTGDSFSSPAWSGIRNRTYRDAAGEKQRAFVSPPTEYK